MKWINNLIVAVSLILLTACSDNQGGLSKKTKERVEREVLESFNQLVESVREIDANAYFDLFDQDKFVGLNANGSNWNSIDDLKALIEPGFAVIAQVDSLNFNNVKVSVIDENTAILVNEFEQTIVLKNGNRVSSGGGGTQVWSKASGNWKLVSVSASQKL